MDMPSLLSNPLLPWAVGLSLGFPLLMVALGEIISHGRLRGWASTGILSGIRMLVVPSLALIIFLRYILEWPADNTVLQLIGTFFWIVVLYQSLAFLNQVVFGSAKAGSWQSRVPSLVRDLARFTLVAIGASLIYSEVWGKEVGAAWAALGLGSVVIGLALQEPLGNIVSGLILLAERPLAIGDFITADGTTGQVTEINWRSVYVQTSDLELKIIPNSALYRASFSNLSRPTCEHAGGVDLRFSSAHPPSEVKDIMMDVIHSVPNIIDHPPPSVSIVEYAGDAIVYRLRFTVERPDNLGVAKDIVLTRAWYAAKRAELNIPGQPPSEDLIQSPHFLLREFDIFNQENNANDQITPYLKSIPYGRGETVVEENGPLKGLYVVVKGRALLTARDRDGNPHQIGDIHRGDFFGETAMVIGQPSDYEVTAMEDTHFLVIEPAGIQILLEKSPRLVHAMGHVLEARRASLQTIRKLKNQKSA